jgi:hypothetical protein
MKRRLLDVLKFPAKITIPSNVRFIGAINVDETTHYFSPKILDRVHIVKFENPLLLEEVVREYSQRDETEPSQPVYVPPTYWGKRTPYPAMDEDFITEILKKINRDFLLKLSIDFGIRSIRQAIHYSNLYNETIHEDKSPEFGEPMMYKINLDPEGEKTMTVFPEDLTALNTLVNQKILPRILLDGNELLSSEQSKLELLTEFAGFLKEKLSVLDQDKDAVFYNGIMSHELLDNMIRFAEHNNGQVNFWTVSKNQ